MDLDFELRAVLAAEDTVERQTIYLPITGMRGHPPEELGVAFVSWDDDDMAVSAEPHRWPESLPVGGGRSLDVTLMSVSAAMDGLHESPRAVSGALMGCLRHEQRASGAALQAVLATDARCPQTHRPRADRQPALLRATVANDQALAILVDRIDERRDVLLNLGLQRRGDHPASTLTSQLIQRDRDLIIPRHGEPANIPHGVPSCRPTPASVFSNREGTPPSSSSPSTTSGYISIASASADKTVRVWDAQSHDLVQVIHMFDVANALRLDASGAICVAAGFAICRLEPPRELAIRT
jgi:hypothetical protein